MMPVVMVMVLMVLPIAPRPFIAAIVITRWVVAVRPSSVSPAHIFEVCH